MWCPSPPSPTAVAMNRQAERRQWSLLTSELVAGKMKYKAEKIIQK